MKSESGFSFAMASKPFYKSLISLQFCIPCRLFCLYGAEDALIQVQFLKFNLWSNFLDLGLAFPRL